jgi:hypothetical protein
MLVPPLLVSYPYSSEDLMEFGVRGREIVVADNWQEHCSDEGSGRTILAPELVTAIEGLHPTIQGGGGEQGKFVTFVWGRGVCQHAGSEHSGGAGNILNCISVTDGCGDPELMDKPSLNQPIHAGKISGM